MSSPLSNTATASRSTLTIGDVLAHLKPEFPDLTISKIRFLETEGLIQPERTPSGYRKFSAADVNRLRYVLGQQRDHYLPLRVIKDQLDAMDRGLVPPSGGGGRNGQRPAHVSVVDNTPAAEAFRAGPPTVRLTRSELLSAAGLRSEQLSEAEQYGLIAARPGGVYDEDALSIGTVVAELARYGIEGRHLRSFRAAAEREVGLFSQVVGPVAKHRNPDARNRAEETVRELAALSVRLHAALVQIGLRSVLNS